MPHRARETQTCSTFDCLHREMARVAQPFQAGRAGAPATGMWSEEWTEPPLAMPPGVPQHGQSGPSAVPQLGSCGSSGPGGFGRCGLTGREAGPSGAKPLPRALELAASKAAHFPAVDPSGPASAEARAAEQRGLERAAPHAIR